MTHLQKLIRTQVLRDGFMFLQVGTGSPATMATIKSLQRNGYSCVRRGSNGNMDVWLIEHPAI